MAKTIAVVGATGTQGGSVAYTMLGTKQWHVRAITRNASSDAAKALAAAGAEIVVADANDEDSLARAFEGAHAIFAVTNFWEAMFTGSSSTEAGEKELAQGKNLANAASRTQTLEHYLWSTMVSTSDSTDEKFPCPHWDYKAKVDAYIQEQLPELATRTTFIMVTWYSSNMSVFPIMKPIALPGSGKYVWLQPARPSTRLMVSGDMKVNPGLWARQVLTHPEKTKAKYITVTTETLSLGEILKMWSEVTSQDAVYLNINLEEFERVWGPPGAELAMQYKFNEVVTDWEAVRKGDFINPKDIGINSSNFVGMREALRRLK